MIKQIIVSMLISSSLVAMKPIQYPYKTQVNASTKKLHPKNTMLAFDINEVVVTGRSEGYKKWLGGHQELAKALGEISQKYPKLKDASAIINKVIEIYPHFKDEALEFQKQVIKASPVQGTWDILNALSANGYQIIAASNMTPSTYQAMVTEKILPSQFSKNIFFVPINEINKKNDGNYYEKTDIQYYQNLARYINRHFPGITTIIFIDNKPENALKAQEVPSIKGIHFKNPEQLRTELKELGIDIK